MKNPSRRRFIKTAGATAMLPLAGSAGFASKPKTMKNIFVHQVYFWLKTPESKDDIHMLIGGLQKLATVKTIKSYHIGHPAGTPREVVDGSYAVSWLAFFKTKADQDAYQVDPIHKKFVEDYSHLWSKVVVYDSVDA
ncbi:MAG: Dabb family protein [Saprospiraceae bacterium]|nr:MAG: Dabb family protein [Saprospiraceae bacterium]